MGGAARCARCQRPMSRQDNQPFAVPSEVGVCLEEAPAPKRNPVEELRDVETDRRMEQWRRMLKSSSNSAGQKNVKRRFDPPEMRRRPAPSPKPQPRPQGQALAWLLATLGTMAMIFGVGILAWSLAMPQPLWWNWGVGITLAGQSIMVAALIQLLASLWNQSRHASGRLTAVQQELAELQRTADLLMSSRTSGAASFYADVARQANPQLLLVNLKGQLDELAARLK
jgi:hypothetical protein